jgi:uncharacterized membrane protein YccC
MARAKRRHRRRRDSLTRGRGKFDASELLGQLFGLQGDLFADFARTRDPVRAQAEDARRRDRAAAKSRGELRERVEDLEYQLGTLMLLNRTLIQVLKERSDWDTARFAEVLRQIDLEDGVLDDRAPPPRRSPASDPERDPIAPERDGP